MIAQLAETSALVAEPIHAAQLQPLLRPYADRCLITGAGAAYFGAVSYFLGRLATVLRRWDEGDHWFQMAARAEESMDAQPTLARTQIAWAAMLRERSAVGDRARGEELAGAALSTAAQLGLPALRERASSIVDGGDRGAPASATGD